jgi:hypothetical protein
MAEPTKELLELIFAALDHAVESIVNTDGPLIPFAMIESASGERSIARFTGGRNPDEARQDARAHVAQTTDCPKYAIAADGTATEDGQRLPVIMIEAGQRGQPHGFRFIQRFASSRQCRFAQPIRNPSIIDHPAVL